MNLSMILFLTFLAAALLFAGCIQQAQQTQQQPTSEKPQTHYVSLSSEAAKPSVLEVKAGDTVVWINQDPELTHVIAFAGESSPELKNGESWSKTFEQKGTFNYVDGLYGMIEGTIVVK